MPMGGGVRGQICNCRAGTAFGRAGSQSFACSNQADSLSLECFCATQLLRGRRYEARCISLESFGVIPGPNGSVPKKLSFSCVNHRDSVDPGHQGRPTTTLRSGVGDAFARLGSQSGETPFHSPNGRLRPARMAPPSKATLPTPPSNSASSVTISSLLAACPQAGGPAIG